MFSFGPVEWLIIGVVVLILIAFIYRKTHVDSLPGFSAQSSFQPPPMDWNAVNDVDVQNFIQRGQKINAIKRYRELTGMGLKEAKDAIDYVIANPQAVGEKKHAPLPNLQGEGVRDLVKAGKIDEAVDVYAKFAGVDIYTAKDAVAAMQRELGTQAPADAPNAAVLALMQQGNKIGAIKAYREQTGLGLREAKAMIDQLALGVSPTASNPPASTPAGQPVPPANDEVVTLIRQGNKIGAIKAYREQTGLGLKEAKDAVEQMEREMKQ